VNKESFICDIKRHVLHTNIELETAKPVYETGTEQHVKTVIM